MFSQTTEYAIRAMIELARKPEGEFILSKSLGDELGIPAFYLAKILQQLTRARILESGRGRRGGFRMARAADEVSLHEVVSQFEDVAKTDECILGRERCSDKEACPLHNFWKDVRTRYVKELEGKTIAQLAEHEDLWQSRRGPARPAQPSAGKATMPAGTRRKK